jgi:hypothetical protein
MRVRVSTLLAVTNVNGSSDDRDPYVRGDGKVLYFGSNRAGVGSYDIYVSTRGAPAN